MSQTRMGRVNEELQRELAALIPTVKDPRVAAAGLISVTGVDATTDLKLAKVYVSVLDRGDVREVLKGLKSASGYLRRELSRTLNLRNTPELLFQEDTSIGHGARIGAILKELERKGEDHGS